LKKLVGNTETEDSLQKLDKLTQEEARMAAAEHMRITRGVEEGVQVVRCEVEDVGKRVQGVDDKVEDVGKMVQDVDERVQDRIQDVDDNVQDVNHKLDAANRLSPPHYSSIRCLKYPTGNQLRDSLLRWLAPPDPSINHNIASEVHHNGTSQWFLQGSTFKQWKTTESLLWIHGKRMFLFYFTSL